MNTSEPFAIVSPERADLPSEDNDSRVEQLRQKLNDDWKVPNKEVVGFYDGTWEVSFVIRSLPTARMIGILYNQHRILEVDANGQAWLVSPTLGEGEYLGPFIETESPELQMAFTHDPFTGKYWTVRSTEHEHTGTV